MIRALLTARDPGPAQSIIALANHLNARPEFEVIVVAGEPAYSIVRLAIPGTIPYELSDGTSFVDDASETDELKSKASRILDETQPDIVITTVSSLGIGLDEAIPVVTNVPTIALQDFWGDANLGLGPADFYIVLDDYAVDLTLKRWALPSVAIGSPKYDRYADFDIARVRAKTRATLNGNTRTIISYFGQPDSVDGVAETYRQIVDAVSELDRDVIFVLREHPKCPALATQHVLFAEDAGLDVHDVTDQGTPDEWLVASDLILTPFSVSGLDHAYISSRSPEPIGSVIYVQTCSRIRASVDRLTGIPRFPTVDRGIGHCVTRRTDLLPTMDHALSDRGRKEYHDACAALSCGNVCQRIEAFVKRHVSRLEPVL